MNDDPVLDNYECKHCDGAIWRPATPENIIENDPDVRILFCPFCGEEYEQGTTNKENK